MMKMKNAANYSRKWLADGASLFVETIQQQGKSNPSSFRAILLTEAKNNQNRAATSMLMVDREIGLLKYHGFMNYITQHSLLSRIQLPFHALFDKLNVSQNSSQSRSRLPSSASTNVATITSNTTASVNPKKAKVAFMITATQRAQLADMGFTVSQIKRLKPVEALLILEHELAPPESEGSESDHANFNQKLKKLVDENEQEQRLQMQSILSQTVSSTKKEEFESLKEADLTLDESAEPLLEQQNIHQLDDSEESREVVCLPSRSNPVSDSSLSLTGNGKKGWFEVLETIQNVTSKNENVPSSITSVIGLYKSEEEANFCREIKQNAAEKRKSYNRENKEKRLYTVREKTELE